MSDTEPKLIKRQYHVSVKELNAEKRVLRFLATDDSVDRDGDIVSIDGWDTAAYLKNPVFLWTHDYHVLTVGKCVSLVVDKRKGLIFDIQFPTINEISSTPDSPHEHVKFIDTLYLMYKGAYINAVSVGMIPKETIPRLDEETGKYLGNNITKKELLELSAVPVPSNINALRLASCEKSIDKKSLKMIEQAMKLMEGKMDVEEKSKKEALEAIHGHLTKCEKCHKEAEASHTRAMDSHKEAGVHLKNAMDGIKSFNAGKPEDKPGEDEGKSAPETESEFDMAKFKSAMEGGK